MIHVGIQNVWLTSLINIHILLIILISVMKTPKLYVQQEVIGISTNKQALLRLANCTDRPWKLPCNRMRHFSTCSVRVWRAGYKVKCVDGVKYRYSYMERGSPSSTQPSLLFINGFGGSKEDWTPLVKVPHNCYQYNILLIDNDYRY